MRVAVVGGGGREHALCWALASHGHEVVAAPGNGGTAGLPVASSDVAGLAGHDLVVVGPEGPLAAGLADSLAAAGTPVFGPGLAGARLEASKAWARDFAARHGVASPGSAAFDDAAEARRHLAAGEPPWFIKADGLCGGKGAFPAPDRATADALVGSLLEEGSLGDAGSTVVVEEWIQGPEFSVHVVVSTPAGTREHLPASRDHKRRHDGDLGPNTGGMGAFAPVPVDAALAEAIEEDVVGPTLAGLAAEGIDYRGALYFGVMATPTGPRLLEYNVRFGDPETQVLLPLLETDPAELFLAAALGEPGPPSVARGLAATTVVLAADGYPEGPETGLALPEIPAPGRAAAGEALVFHAGTGRRDGALVSTGGRILAVTGLGDDLAESRRVAYRAVSPLAVPGTSFRSDIAVPA